MKKSYVKPQLYFENFQLSTSIAAGCGFATNHAKGDCNYIPNVGTVFSQNPTCLIVPDESGVCYQISVDGQKVFTSL